MTKTYIDDDGCCKLIEAVIVQGGKDYISLLKRKWKAMLVGSVSDTNAIVSKIDMLEQFFIDMNAIGFRDACYKKAKEEFNSKHKKNRRVNNR